jgi:hypothetical protein
MNDRVLAVLVFLLGYRVEVMGGVMAMNNDLTAIWVVALGVMLTFLSFSIVNEANE